MSTSVHEDESDLTSSMLVIEDHPLTTNIYLLWTSGPDDGFKIQAVFGSAVQHDFERIDQFRSNSGQSIIVYRLKHQTTVSSEQTSSASNERRRNDTKQTFSMRITNRAQGSTKSYEDSTSLIADTDIPFQFLFEAKFQSRLLRQPRGEQSSVDSHEWDTDSRSSFVNVSVVREIGVFVSLVRCTNEGALFHFLFKGIHSLLPISRDLFSSSRLGSSVPFWNQLYFFTYFLIENDMHEAFDYLLHQFSEQICPGQGRILSRDELTAFFLTCYTQLPKINNLLRESEKAFELYLRMLGILPISKDNFPVYNDTLDSLIVDLYDHTKKHFSQLLSVVNGPNRSMMVRGLTVLMCIPLLSNRNTFDTISLLREISGDHPGQRSAIVHELLKRVIEFRIPIQMQNWAGLFTFATDKYLFCQSLDLVTTLDDYLIVLLHAIRTCSFNAQNQTELTEKLDRLIHPKNFVRTYSNLVSF